MKRLAGISFHVIAPGPASPLVRPIIALYSQNQALANLRHTSSATHAGCSWLEEMHWLVETDIEDELLLTKSETLAALNHLADARAGAASTLASALRHDSPHSANLRRAQELVRRLGSQACRIRTLNDRYLES